MRRLQLQFNLSSTTISKVVTADCSHADLVIYYAPPHRADALYVSDVCLSVAYIGPKLRTERHRKTKIGTELAHVTRDSDTRSKGQRSRLQSYIVI